MSTNGFSFAAVLQAIATSTNANLLSTPSILTLDNAEAKILVGQEVPFRTGTFTTNANGADNPFTTIQRKDVGITLTVTPHIHDGTAVRLDVKQEVSNLVLSSLAAVSPRSDVVTNKREIKTTVRRRRNVVLGVDRGRHSGHEESAIARRYSLLGKLFQNVQTQHTKKSLLVFLRPPFCTARGSHRRDQPQVRKV